MNVKLLTEQHLAFLILKGRCTGWSESTLVKIQYCLKSHALAHFKCVFYIQLQMMNTVVTTHFVYVFKFLLRCNSETYNLGEKS